MLSRDVPRATVGVRGRAVAPRRADLHRPDHPIAGSGSAWDTRAAYCCHSVVAVATRLAPDRRLVSRGSIAPCNSSSPRRSPWWPRSPSSRSSHICRSAMPPCIWSSSSASSGTSSAASRPDSSVAFVGGLALDILGQRPLGSSAFALLIAIGIASLIGGAPRPGEDRRPQSSPPLSRAPSTRCSCSSPPPPSTAAPFTDRGARRGRAVGPLRHRPGRARGAARRGHRAAPPRGGAGGLVNDSYLGPASPSGTAPDPLRRLRDRHDPGLRPARRPASATSRSRNGPGRGAGRGQANGRGGRPGPARPHLRPHGHGCSSPTSRHSRCGSRPADLPYSRREDVARRLGGLLGMEPSDILTTLDSAPGSRFDPVRIAQDVPEATARLVSESTDELPGVQVAVETRREYPDGPLLAHILGYTGPIDGDTLEPPRGDGYLPDDMIGKAGVEATFEDGAARAPTASSSWSATRPAGTSRSSRPSRTPSPAPRSRSRSTGRSRRRPRRPSSGA